MKYELNLKLFILTLFLIHSIIAIDKTSILKIDVVEAVNLHCKLNNEFHCNPYVVINSESDSSINQSTHKLECTKNPKWESSFTFFPNQCYGKISLFVYQFLTPNDINFIGKKHLYDEQNYMKGETEAGYLGRIVLEMEKLPFGSIDDWFLLEAPVNNDRIQFPSCVHLRIKWTSTKCTEHPSSTYQALSPNQKLKPFNDFKSHNYIPMCKKDFAMIYKTRFSRLDTVNTLKTTNELDKNKQKVCLKDPYQDYGFENTSNLTSIEESLVYKIVKRNTGENLNFESFLNEAESSRKYTKSYREFFNNKCFTKDILSKERINNILRNEAEQFPENTNNPYVSRNNPYSLNEKMNFARLKTVYNDTLSQFFILEDVKNLDKMDDDTYMQTVQRFSSKMKDINYEKKIDQSIFEFKNKVKLTFDGIVDKEEYPFFKIYALYKLDGGKLPYDQLKKEYTLSPNLFSQYMRSKMNPTNIVYNFAEDECPANTVCIDPNGIVLKSKGEDPNIALRREKSNLRDFEDFHFKEKKSNTNLKLNNKNVTHSAKEIDRIILNDKLQLRKKKEILINKVFDIFPLLGEILAVCNVQNFDQINDNVFQRNEKALLEKYLLMWIPDCESSCLVTDYLYETLMNKSNYLCPTLNKLMDALPYGDRRSIRVFKEIILTIMMDTIINVKSDKNAFSELLLMKILNKPFEFKVIFKVNFVNLMRIPGNFKEKLTLLIMKYDSNPSVMSSFRFKIDKLTNKNIDENSEFSGNKTISKKRINEKDFYSHENEISSRVYNQKVLNSTKLNFNLNQSKSYNITEKLNKAKERLKESVDKAYFNETFEDLPFLQEYNNFQKGVNNRTIYPKLRKHVNNMIQLNNIFENNTQNNHVKQLVNLPRFKSLNKKGKVSKSLMTTNFAKMAYSLAKREYGSPSEQQIIEKMLRNPNTRSMIEEALKNHKNKVMYSNGIQRNFQILHKRSHVQIVDKHRRTREMIRKTILNGKSFDDFLNIKENEEIDDPTGLFNVLKGIQQSKCSCGYLCIEIGTIYGDWDSLRARDVEVQTKETEDVNLIIKPVIIVNNIDTTPSSHNESNIPPGHHNNNSTGGNDNIKVNQDEECEEFDLFNAAKLLHFKEMVKPKIQRKFYRKVQIGEKNYANDIFKQGLNIILIERNKLYSKVFEKTYDTNNQACESEELARVIRDEACEKIIVITGIGKWMGSITPSLIREIKNIGGPDLKNTFSADFQDNEMADHAFILVGRRGLCAYNGVFRIKNYDIPQSIKSLSPNLSSDPNDCYFEDVSLENLKNKENQGKFYHLIDYRFGLNLNADNRFAYNAPSVTKVTPFKAHVRGGDLLKINGYNFGDNPDNVSEVYVKNVLCTKPKVINPKLITCISGENSDKKGIGNVIVKLRNGMSSPSKTCDMFEYFGVLQKKENNTSPKDNKKKCVYSSPKIVSNLKHLK